MPRDRTKGNLRRALKKVAENPPEPIKVDFAKKFEEHEKALDEVYNGMAKQHIEEHPIEIPEKKPVTKTKGKPDGKKKSRKRPAKDGSKQRNVHKAAKSKKRT